MKHVNHVFAAAGLVALAAGVSVPSASAAISGGPYVATNTTEQVIHLGGASVRVRSAALVGDATGSNTTTFNPNFSCASVTVAGMAYKATVSTAGGWSFTRTGPLTGGSYSGTVGVGPSVIITGYNQAYGAGGPCAPVTGSPIQLGTVTVSGGPGLGAMTATPGPGSTFTAAVAGLNYASAGLWAVWVGSGSSGTWTGSFVAPGVTVSAP